MKNKFLKDSKKTFHIHTQYMVNVYQLNRARGGTPSPVKAMKTNG
jgi:hypothetical protein